MKKIGFVVYDISVLGGVEKVTVELANALADFFEVEIISVVLRNHDIYKLDSRINVKVLLDKESRLRIMRKSVTIELSKYLVNNSIDIAVLQGSYAGFLACMCRFKTKTKMVFCDHGALVNEWEKRKITLMRYISAVCSNKVVCLTKRNANDYKVLFRIAKNKILVIPNFIDIKDKERIAKYNNCSKKIISVGRFGKEKGFELLIHIFSRVACLYPEWNLDIYGDGETKDNIQDLIDKYDLNDRVLLKGIHYEVREKYSEYAMYVLPSIREGLPLVLLEAKANKLPIISFDIITGPQEIIVNGKDGILVPPYDLDKFSEAMCYLIENDNTRKEMSLHSYDNMHLFSKEKVIKSWIELIEGPWK